MYIFDTSPYTSDNPQFTEEDIENMLPPTYGAWKDLFDTYIIEIGGEHEKANLRPDQCWWFPWKILRTFFQSKGYRLYDFDPQNHPNAHPQMTDPPAADAFGLLGHRKNAISSMKPNSMIFGARDSSNRDVVIKLVDKYSPDCPKGSVELQILHFLNSPSMRLDPRNATVPVIGFLDFHDWRFAVMPTYENSNAYYFLSSRECLDFAAQVSEALSFLHEHNIAHLDISHENILMNFRGDIPEKYLWTEADSLPIKVSPPPEFRSTFPIKYSLIDFGYSAYFLPGLPRSKCRVIPFGKGRPHRAPEVDGRFKHDPFAADVYQTAIFFYSYFGRIICTEVPGLLETLQDMSSIHAPDRISMAVASCRIRALLEKLPPHEALPRHSIEMQHYYYVPRSRFRYYREYTKWFIAGKWKSLLMLLGGSDSV